MNIVRNVEHGVFVRIIIRSNRFVIIDVFELSQSAVEQGAIFSSILRKEGGKKASRFESC